MGDFHAIVLCAGIGERLRPLTYKTNKSLLTVKGKTIIEHLLDTLTMIDTAHIVVGHYAYKFRELLGSRYGNLKIQFHVNPLFRITGGAQSIYVASQVLSRHPCVIIDGDHYFDPELMKTLMESKYENCVLVDTSVQPPFDEELLAYGYMGVLSRLAWLPPYPPDPLGEALGFFKLSKKASSALSVVLEQYLLEDGAAKREYIEPFNRLIQSHDMHYVSTEGKRWTDIDFGSDYEEAKRQ